MGRLNKRRMNKLEKNSDMNFNTIINGDRQKMNKEG